MGLFNHLKEPVFLKTESEARTQSLFAQQIRQVTPAESLLLRQVKGL